MQDHVAWMRLALAEAQKALDKNEVPVGAIVVHEDRVVGRGHNLIESLQDPTAHAEMLAVTAAANALASWRLDQSILYVTLEPCMMCTGAALLSRIPLIVYGAADPRYGACGSALQLTDGRQLDVQARLISGVLHEECSDLLKRFFRKLR
ncbi:MAG TPA: tRNA adenosine(34) deaminase TadA [bacterium]|nr:tRNA adenosine(34) deaminase TadA [bacterium]HQG44695.1 tRNA adenosine(34) deaminase TadA [bacterium]HQI47333.1 tRNA adenosine(34) deaminase TadA [bacterium]HQJ63392.1 tRNA adenosine(34) deaminase TadA [bacterium]